MKDNKMKIKEIKSEQWVDLYASVDVHIRQGETESIPLKVKECGKGEDAEFIYDRVEIDFDSVEFNNEIEGLYFSIDKDNAISYVIAECVLGNTVFSGIYTGSIIKYDTKIGRCRLLNVLEVAEELDVTHTPDEVVEVVAKIQSKKKK